MSKNIITPEFRAGFVAVLQATSGKNEDGTVSAPKFSIRACFPPSADLSEMKAEAEAAANAKWPTGLPKSLRSPFRANEELDKPVPGVPDDWIVMTFSMNETKKDGGKQKPGVVDANLSDVIDSSVLYKGAWFRVQCNAYGYEAKGNKGVTFGLQNVQKLRDDEPLPGGVQPAKKVFEAFGTPAKTAGGMFD